MKKRLFALLVSGVLSLAMLTACGETNEPAAETAAAEKEPAAEAAAEVTDTAAADSDEEIDMEAELQAVQDTLTYMGGLYISDPQNDLMFSLFKNENGDLVAVVNKLGAKYYGIIGETEDKTLDDGRQYTAFTVEDHTFGYCFGDDSFVVDEDGSVYAGKDVDESVARDMVADMFNAGGR